MSVFFPIALLYDVKTKQNQSYTAYKLRITILDNYIRYATFYTVLLQPLSYFQFCTPHTCKYQHLRVAHSAHAFKSKLEGRR